jgi:hypothetical protein
VSIYDPLLTHDVNGASMSELITAILAFDIKFGCEGCKRAIYSPATGYCTRRDCPNFEEPPKTLKECD